MTLKFEAERGNPLKPKEEGPDSSKGGNGGGLDLAPTPPQSEPPSPTLLT